jgi:hypothetical protein
MNTEAARRRTVCGELDGRGARMCRIRAPQSCAAEKLQEGRSASEGWMAGVCDEMQKSPRRVQERGYAD